MYAFWLGREFKLSLAEIHALFPKAQFTELTQEFALVSGVEESEILRLASRMGGVIKIIALSPDYEGKPADIVLQDAEKKDGKFAFGLSVFGESSTKSHLMGIKKSLKEAGKSVRFVNKNFQNLSSAQIIGESLVRHGTDYSLIVLGRTEYFGKTIWVQDIEAYSKRDYGKTRDMIVGMLPPKLSQMMINIAMGSKKPDFTVYDPFCGLGTVLLESIYMGNASVYGSDISLENIEKTKANLSFARKNFTNNVKTAEAFVLDAKGISSSPALKKSDCIVTEGYLGQIFQKYTISPEKVASEQVLLMEIYTKFFEGLKRANYSGSIVISFPFWDIRGKYYFFEAIYPLLEKYCKIESLLPFQEIFKHTRYGSLLYKRKDQLVGREIFKLKIK